MLSDTTHSIYFSSTWVTKKYGLYLKSKSLKVSNKCEQNRSFFSPNTFLCINAETCHVYSSLRLQIALKLFTPIMFEWFSSYVTTFNAGCDRHTIKILQKGKYYKKVKDRFRKPDIADASWQTCFIGCAWLRYWALCIVVDTNHLATLSSSLMIIYE